MSMFFGCSKTCTKASTKGTLASFTGNRFCLQFPVRSLGLLVLVIRSLLYAHFMHVANGFISTEMTQDCIKLHLYYDVVPCHLEDTALDDCVINR